MSTPALKPQINNKLRARPAEMTDKQFKASSRAPISPSERAQDDIWGNSEGDKDYQIDQAYQYNESDAGKKEFENWRQQTNPNTGESNSLWYNKNRTRTDYAGKYSPSLSEQRSIAARGAGGAGNIRDPNSPVIGGTYNADGTSNYGSDPIDMTDPGSTETEPDSEDPTTEDPTSDTPALQEDRKLEKGTEFNYTKQTIGEGELGTTDNLLLDDPVTVSKDNLEVLAVEQKDLGILDVNTVENLPELETVLAGITDDDLIAEVTSEVTERYKEAEAESRRTVENFKAYKGSTVREQFAMLQDDWVGVDGQSKIPFYARGAITAAKQAMAVRGMGGSSMAAVAITQAGLESMMPMAMADAQFMQTLSVKSFDAQTAIDVAKLSHIAMLDVSDLTFRQTRAVDTANKFFQMNMDNVSNERIVAATNNANEVQKLFNDQAAENVANNLAYTTEAEMTKFYDQMAFQAADSTARLMLDADKFNAATKNARGEFNTRMKAEIEQDNINYLRSINTASTAGVNQANMINTQNLLKISNTEIANKLTLQRDHLNHIFEASENAEARANNYAIAKLTSDGNKYKTDQTLSHQNSSQLGAFAGSILKEPITDFAEWGSNAIKNIFTGSSKKSTSSSAKSSSTGSSSVAPFGGTKV